MKTAEVKKHERAIYLVLMIDSTVTALFVPISLLYFVALSGASLAAVGVLIGAAGIVTLPLPLWVGKFVDSAGAKPAVLAAQLVQAAGTAVYLFAVDPALIFIGALIFSLGQRLFWSSIFTLVTEISDGDVTASIGERRFATVAALRATGYGAGALVAGLALSVHSLLWWKLLIAANLLLLLFAASAVALAIPKRIKTVRKGQTESYGRLWRDGPYLFLIGVNSIFALCNVMLAVALPPFISKAFPALVWSIGPFLAFNTTFQVLGQSLVTRLMKGVKREHSLCIAGGLWAGWCLLTASSLIIPAALRLICLSVAIFCYSTAQVIHGPVSNALSTEAAPDESRGRYLAMFQYSFGVAGVAAAPIYSVLTGIEPSLPWLALASAAILTLPATLVIVPRLALSGAAITEQ